MNDAGNGCSRFDRDGCVVFPQVISLSLGSRISSELTPLFELQQKSAKNRIGGVRNLLQTNPLVAEVANSVEVKTILRRELGVDAFPVRSIFFDKTREANWSVAWHQDLTIAVASKIETPGFGSWTLKAGVPHVQPPADILRCMATLRLHLDECDEANGALKVIPESHAQGVLSPAEIERWKARTPIVCAVPLGGALLMRPLLLHMSSSALNPLHRRVLHIEYATEELPNGLKWFERP